MGDGHLELSADGWARLHQLRLRGPHPAPDDDATAALVAAGLAAVKGAYLAATPEGRAAHADWARVPAGSDAETAARAAYERFLVVDDQLKHLIHDWQTTAGKSGPMSAEEWDLVDKLKDLDGKAGPFLRRLTAAVERFAVYRPRLTHALAQVEEGDRPWFCGLTIDSYHTAWWQLHEDLLAALGIARADDPNQ